MWKAAGGTGSPGVCLGNFDLRNRWEKICWKLWLKALSITSGKNFLQDPIFELDSFEDLTRNTATQGRRILVRWRMKYVYFWFRRDLRDQDQVGFIMPWNRVTRSTSFIFLISKFYLESWIPRMQGDLYLRWSSKIKKKFQDMGIGPDFFGMAILFIWSELCQDPDLHGIYCNRSWTVSSMERSSGSKNSQRKIFFFTLQGYQRFERDEILTGQGTVYSVFLYGLQNKWLQSLSPERSVFFMTVKSGFKI